MICQARRGVFFVTLSGDVSRQNRRLSPACALCRPLLFIFASLTILFFLLSIGDFTGNEAIQICAGYKGIMCGASAIYTGLAQVLNEVYGREIAPPGKI
jgi:succinate-acetate transporter protein